MTCLVLLTIWSCERNTHQNLLTEVIPVLEGKWVNMVVEIPAGSREKWEVNKETGLIERDSLNGQPRTINYLGYPANYGFIPQTLLPKSQGGDGDPLDVLVIGDAREKGTVLRCKIIGVLKLLDNGEQDDKLIAVSENSVFDSNSTIEDLQNNFPGMLGIIETWFTNYKGGSIVLSNGFRSKDEALKILEQSVEAYSVSTQSL